MTSSAPSERSARGSRRHDVRGVPAPPEAAGRWSVVVLVGVATAMLLAAFEGTWRQPYLFLDDNYIVRGHDPDNSHPDLFGLHGVIQGRPVMAVLLALSRMLTTAAGPDAIVYVRLAGILALGLYAGLVALAIERALGSRPAALGAALAMASLPAFQVVAAAGPWLPAGLVMAALAYFLVEHALSSRGRPVERLLAVSAAFAALGLALGSYQPMAQVYVAFAALGVLFAPTSRAALVRAGAHALLWTATLTTYFLLWTGVYRIAFPSLVETRYSPDGVSLDPLAKIQWFVDTRLVQVANLWDVSAGGDRLGAMAVAAVALLAVATLLDSVRRRARHGAVGLVAPVWRLAVLFVAMIASDAAALASRNDIPSYTTALPSSQTFAFALVWACAELTRGAAAMRLRPLVFAAIAIGGLITARDQVERYFVAPLAFESAATREALTSADPERVGLGTVEVVMSGKPPGRSAFAEYGWNNLSAPFYVNWFVRNQLWALGRDENALIIAVDPGSGRQEVLLRGPLSPQPASAAAIVDLAAQRAAPAALPTGVANPD